MQTFNKKEQVNVLFVDDDEGILNSAKQCLKLHGNYNIDYAFSVDEALKKVAKTDIIISDLQMPLRDGLDFLKTLRENNNQIPFILFTVTEDKEKILQAFSLGASGFVEKNGKPQAIFSTLQKYIEQFVHHS